MKFSIWKFDAKNDVGHLSFNMAKSKAHGMTINLLATSLPMMFFISDTGILSAFAVGDSRLNWWKCEEIDEQIQICLLEAVGLEAQINDCNINVKYMFTIARKQ